VAVAETVLLFFFFFFIFFFFFFFFFFFVVVVIDAEEADGVAELDKAAGPANGAEVDKADESTVVLLAPAPALDAVLVEVEVPVEKPGD